MLGKLAEEWSALCNVVVRIGEAYMNVERRPGPEYLIAMELPGIGAV
jgi:hypothetical protein